MFVGVPTGDKVQAAYAGNARKLSRGTRPQEIITSRLPANPPGLRCFGQPGAFG